MCLQLAWSYFISANVHRVYWWFQRYNTIFVGPDMYAGHPVGMPLPMGMPNSMPAPTMPEMTYIPSMIKMTPAIPPPPSKI